MDPCGLSEFDITAIVNCAAGEIADHDAGYFEELGWPIEGEAILDLETEDNEDYPLLDNHLAKRPTILYESCILPLFLIDLTAD